MKLVDGSQLTSTGGRRRLGFRQRGEEGEVEQKEKEEEDGSPPCHNRRSNANYANELSWHRLWLLEPVSNCRYEIDRLDGAMWCNPPIRTSRRKQNSEHNFKKCISCNRNGIGMGNMQMRCCSFLTTGEANVNYSQLVHESPLRFHHINAKLMKSKWRRNDAVEAARRGTEYEICKWVFNDHPAELSAFHRR